MPQYSGIWTLSQAAQAIKNLDWAGVAPTVIEYLVVGGGGGGGAAIATGGNGGGGGGGFRQDFAGITPGNSYFITVGAGGAGSGTEGVAGTNGNNSVFGSTSSDAQTGTIISLGGGGGGSAIGTGAGLPTSGGSGGGGWGLDNATYPFVSGAAGTNGQGNAGGRGARYAGTSFGAGGGGGGAGSQGGNSTTNLSGGMGGMGAASNITCVNIMYAGGGGGGCDARNAVGYEDTSATLVYTAPGGFGGGGSGSYGSNTAAIPGVANTGGGAGGGSIGYTGAKAGGSGIVVIRYPGNVQYFTGGTLNYSNGYIVHTFYSSGILAPIAPRLFASPDYQIQRSLRFNGTNTYLNRTVASASNRKTWTWSGWIKRGALGSSYYMPFGADSGAGTGAAIYFYNDYLNFGQGATTYRTTNQVFRDVFAWYHIVVVLDTTQQTASDRIKFWVNGQQVTNFSTLNNPAQYDDLAFNSAVSHAIGADIPSSGARNYFSGYMTEINFVDGQALTPASFGYVEPSTGVWTPLLYTGSYGTNGFYLNFADNSALTAATLGKDLSGNSNNWIPNNFSITAGAGNSSLVDTPTNYGVDTGVGGEVRGSYATLNPLNAGNSSYISNGNLTLINATENAWRTAVSTIAMSSGKWYAEITVSTNNSLIIGIDKASVVFTSTTTMMGGSATGWGLLYTGQVYNNNGVVYNNNSYAVGDVIGLAFDADAGTMYWYKNGTVMSQTITGLTSGPYVFGLSSFGSSATGNINFGQRPFSYTAPTGFKALCTQNLPESQVGKLAGKHFNTVLWTGTGVNPRSVGGVGFQPDLSWHGRRDVGYGSWMFDSVRGATKRLQVSDNTVESIYTELNSFDADGFTQAGANDQGNNIVNALYFSWNWKGGGTAVTNTTGSITSQVNANSQAGISVVTYTGNNTTGTIGHGLGVTPSLIIVRRRETAANWVVYSSVTGATQFLYLNTTAAAAAWAGFWGNTAPTTSVFTVSNDGATNASAGTYVAYCFAEVAGFSKFGSYVGNGSTDGPFVYCGFRPRWIMIKLSSAAGENWQIIDTARDTYNVAGIELYANLTNAESSNLSRADLISAGFKVRTTNPGWNTSGNTYIFAAFAESPLKYARAR